MVLYKSEKSRFSARTLFSSQNTPTVGRRLRAGVGQSSSASSAFLPRGLQVHLSYVTMHSFSLFVWWKHMKTICDC